MNKTCAEVNNLSHGTYKVNRPIKFKISMKRSSLCDYIDAYILENAELLELLKSGFIRTINRNKYEPKVTLEQQNRYLDFLINPIFQGINRLFCFIIWI